MQSSYRYKKNLFRKLNYWLCKNNKNILQIRSMNLFTLINFDSINTIGIYCVEYFDLNKLYSIGLILQFNSIAIITTWKSI